MQPQILPDDAFVMLDPAVEILDQEIDGHALLCHIGLEVGMAVPPGEGLLDVVKSLVREPVRVGDLRKQYDDGQLLDEILASLAGRGFAHVTPDQPPLAYDLRQALIIDLDAVPLAEVVAAWSRGGPAPEVRLRCSRLSDHDSTLRELGCRRRAGSLRAHHVVVRSGDARCNADTRESLLRLGAAVEIENVAWPAPEQPIDGLAELVRGLIATHVIMSPGVSVLDEAARERCVDWIRGELISGLCLHLDAGALAPHDAAASCDAIRSLEDVLGDVVVTNMPGDEVLLGNTNRGWLAGETSDADRRLRRAYVRWRIPIIKLSEGDNPWSQIPEVEEKWVRASVDLLPNAPELLLARPGSSIVDLCGGMGRVARRLSPAVGDEGVIISIEMRRFLIERARRFALEGNFTNLQFRPGRAERLPLPDASVDAAVNEWTGAIWELGLGPTMVSEMVRVVRPGGRVAVTHRLVQLSLDALHEPWVQYPDIYQWVRDAFRHPELTIVAERVWGQIVPSQAGDNASLWREAYMARLVNANDWVFPADDSDRGTGRADVFLTMIAERRRQ